MKENLKNTTNSHAYKVIAYNLFWLMDKKCKAYCSYWSGKPCKSWKWNRKTKWK